MANRKRFATVIVGILLAADAIALCFSVVSSQFTPILLDVVASPIDSSRRIVTIALPDLSSLRNQTAVFRVRLQNRGFEQTRIGLLRNGFPRIRAVVPANRTVDWEIVVGPEKVRALNEESGDTRRTLELTGERDNWTLTGLDISNYHMHVGRDVVIIPRSQQAGTMLSRMLRYQLLLTPRAFAFGLAGLFSPLIVYLVFAMRARFGVWRRRVIHFWRNHELTFERGAALLGLVAIAIAQPIFDVIANSPEFFAARGSTRAVAIVAVLILCCGIPFALFGIERAIRTLAPRAATTFHRALLAMLVAAAVMPWFRRTDDFISSAEAASGVLAGFAAAIAYGRVRIVRQFLTALAPGALIVPALFLLNPDVLRNFLPSESSAAVARVERTPPVVLVVFDELPLNSLLDGGGNIDAGRYPNFAALAKQAYWFRNAMTVWPNTSYAVPAILSGRYPPSKAVPTLRYYPVNLFTALARHYNIYASMRYQQLCPPRACQNDSAMTGDTVGLLLSDLGLVWLHIVLPQTLAAKLPPVDVDWAEFGGTREVRAGPSGASGRGGVFAEFVNAIDQRPARLYVIHSMVPHMPFEYVPSGHRYRAPDAQSRIYRGAALFEGRSAEYADALHQRHLAQVGFVDRLVGDLIAHLREKQVYDDALVIVTSDHGASYREGRSRRQLQRDNVSDVAVVPLFVKLPWQQRAQVVERIVETVDILPTILDVVGAKASLRLDGRSLISASAAERSVQPFLLRGRFKRPPSAEDVFADRTASLERKERRFGRGDFTGIYAAPAARRLLGVNVSRPPVQPDVQITIRDPQQFASVDRTRDELPLYVQGVVKTARREPLTIAVVVNGTVAAVTNSFRDRNAHAFGVVIPETTLRDGANTVWAFVADASDRLKP